MSETKIYIRYLFSLLFPILYLLTIVIWRDPDRIIFMLGFFGFPLFLIQWLGFLFGGWIISILFTLICLALFGYLVDLIFTKLGRLKKL
jgi:hypothetical protein